MYVQVLKVYWSITFLLVDNIVDALRHLSVYSPPFKKSCSSTINQRARVATFSAKALACNPRNGHLSASRLL
jgi:hypothetical protein